MKIVEIRAVEIVVFGRPGRRGMQVRALEDVLRAVCHGFRQPDRTTETVADGVVIAVE